jgi:hypothetical protein
VGFALPKLAPEPEPTNPKAIWVAKQHPHPHTLGLCICTQTWTHSSQQEHAKIQQEHSLVTSIVQIFKKNKTEQC